MVVAQILSVVALQCDKVPCPLPVKSLVALFKETKVTSYMQLKYYKDDQIVGCASGRREARGKWRTVDAFDLAESRRALKRVVGDVRSRAVEGKVEVLMRAGLGYISFDSSNVRE